MTDKCAACPSGEHFWWERKGLWFCRWCAAPGLFDKSRGRVMAIVQKERNYPMPTSSNPLTDAASALFAALKEAVEWLPDEDDYRCTNLAEVRAIEARCRAAIALAEDWVLNS